MKKIFVFVVTIMCFVCGFSQTLALVQLDSSSYFDFWEGSWEGSWPESDGVGRAINKLQWVSGGKVLLENFEVVEGQSQGFKGTSISVFRPQQNIWKQAWADSQGGYFDFFGSFEGNDRIFQTTPRKQGSDTLTQRMIFHDIEADSFTWNWEKSTDAGKTWTLQWQIKYVRLDAK